MFRVEAAGLRSTSKYIEIRELERTWTYIHIKHLRRTRVASYWACATSLCENVQSMAQLMRVYFSA